MNVYEILVKIEEVYLSTFSVVGFIVNLLTIVAVCRHEGLRKNGTTPFIINLSIANFMYSIVVLPVSVIRRWTEEWILGETLCKIYPLFTFGNLTVCMMTIAAIAINRYCLFCKPQVYRACYTPCKVSVMIIGIWLFSIVQILPSILGIWGTTGLGQDQTLCTIRSNSLGNPKAMLMIVNFLIASVITGVCYFLIYRKVKKNSEMQINNEFYQTSGELLLVKPMLALFIGFSVCHLPITIFIFTDLHYTLTNLYFVTIFLYSAHCLVSPFILFFTDKIYREAYKQAVSCSIYRENNVSTKKEGLGTVPLIPDFHAHITLKK